MSIDINLTFVAELIAFFLFLFFMRTFVLPKIAVTLETRRAYVNTQLALMASADQHVLAARQEALAIIEQARLQVAHNMQEWEVELSNERNHSKQRLAAEIAIMRVQAQQEAQQVIRAAELAMAQKITKNSMLLAEQLLAKNISAKKNADLIQTFLHQL